MYSLRVLTEKLQSLDQEKKMLEHQLMIVKEELENKEKKHNQFKGQMIPQLQYVQQVLVKMKNEVEIQMKENESLLNDNMSILEENEKLVDMIHDRYEENEELCAIIQDKNKKIKQLKEKLMKVTRQKMREGQLNVIKLTR